VAIFPCQGWSRGLHRLVAAGLARETGYQAQYLLNAIHRKYDLSSFVGRSGQHFVRRPSFFERENGAYLCFE